MYDVEKIICQVLEAMIEDLIKEFNNKIKNQAKSIRDLRMSNTCMKKELEKTEILLQSSNTIVEKLRSQKDKVENQLY